MILHRKYMWTNSGQKMEGYIILTRQCHLKEADLKIKLCWGPKNATFLSVFGTNFLGYNVFSITVCATSKYEIKTLICPYLFWRKSWWNCTLIVTIILEECVIILSHSLFNYCWKQTKAKTLITLEQWMKSHEMLQCLLSCGYNLINKKIA